MQSVEDTVSKPDASTWRIRVNHTISRIRRDPVVAEVFAGHPIIVLGERLRIIGAVPIHQPKPANTNGDWPCLT